MIVRLQNRYDTRTFFEPYVGRCGTHYAVYMRVRGSNATIACGQYSDEFRANGVMYEMLDAYENKSRVFYMPAA